MLLHAATLKEAVCNVQGNPSTDKVVHSNATYNCYALNEPVVRRKKV
jgi:hypothetical protein